MFVVDLAPMKFSDLDLHPALSAALAARGYETATGVQAAVLDPGTAGRDLLVSSQTGSGKTIAFGVLLAEALLGSGKPTAAPAGDGAQEGEAKAAGVSPGEPAARAFGPGGKRPAALVIVPTRELAVQVRDELGWLLAKTRLRLGSFTGGTPVSGDLRVLQKGVDVVIGTPGRLVDLLSRERLDLAGLRLVVLDEADEMLDLGFREDLETLLGAANPDRRTLLLSATLPSEIRALARKYQRDALAIDPRKSAGESPAAPHADINYVAHLISPQDRLATVVNVLRASGARRTITFCTTRDAVSSLHAALMARGFTATAISGERAQADRDRALELIRSGRAEVLVATNVAARGLHLPDVDLIIHADLPLNSESLTHRSGRTGRAGRKGTAVVIATLAERRKAERLMALAHVVAPWTPAPTPDSITSAARERLLEALLDTSADTELDAAEKDADLEASAEADGEAATGPRGARTKPIPTAERDPAIDSMLDRLEATLPPREIISRLLRRELERLPGGEPIHPVAMPDARDGRGREMDARARTHHDGRAGVLFRVNMGARDKADPKWMLPLICRRGNVTRREVGAIRIGPTETIFEITEEAAFEFGRAAAETDPRAPHVRVERVSAGPGGSRGPAGHRGPATARFSGPAASASGGQKRSPSRFAKAEPAPSRPVALASTPAAPATTPKPAAPAPVASDSPGAASTPKPTTKPTPATTTPLPPPPTATPPESPAPIANGVAHPAKSRRGGSAPVIERKHAPPPRGLAENVRPERARPAGTPSFHGKGTDAPRAPSVRLEAGPPASTAGQGGFGPPRRFTPHPVAGWGGERSSDRARDPASGEVTERHPSRGGHPAPRPPARSAMAPRAHHEGARGDGGGALGGGHGFGKRGAPFRPGGPRPSTSAAPGGPGDLARARPKPGGFAKGKPSAAGGGFRPADAKAGAPTGRALRSTPIATPNATLKAKVKAKAPPHRK
jgi:ATP-dependent RNA helicase DeaD